MLARRSYIMFGLRRVGQTLLTLLALATLVFIMLKSIPGDEAQVAAGLGASDAQVEIVLERLGLNEPVPVQYLRFLGRLVQGDLGTSSTTYQPVVVDLSAVLPSTMELVIVAMLINLSVAIPLATLSAARRGRPTDSSLRVLAVITGGLPMFWLALMIQFIFGSLWGVLPISGQHSFGFSAPAVTGAPSLDALIAGDIATFWDALRHLVLPAAALATMSASQLFRTLRAALLGVLNSDFIVAVRAKGASGRRVLFRHGLPNGLNPAMTLAGTQFGMMIGTSVLVETVFARQGVGSYLAFSVANRDLYAVLGTVLFVGTVVCLVNLAVDVLLLMMDPRIRAAQIGGAET